MNIYTLIKHIEQTALPEIAASWDASGIQIAGEKEDIHFLAVALDPNEQTINSALNWGAECILTHHPLSLRPKLPQKKDGFFNILSALMKNGAWLYAAHTSLDSQPDGPASWLANDLGLIKTEIIESTCRKCALKIRFPQDSADNTADMFFSSKKEILTTQLGPDNCLEILCWEDKATDIEKLIRQRFSPAWIEARELAAPEKIYGLGCIGDLPQTLSWQTFISKLTSILGHSQFKSAGVVPQKISRLAYCPGSGASLINKAFAAGAHIYITGDVKYHEAQEISQGLVIDAGHFLLEEIMMQRFTRQLQDELAADQIEIRFFAGKDSLPLMDLKQIGQKLFY